MEYNRDELPVGEHTPCSHGLGHLLNPIDPDSAPEGAHRITQPSEHELARAIGSNPSAEDPAWYRQPALGRMNATSPGLLQAFAPLNADKPYADQVKPFNFLIFAQAPNHSSARPESGSGSLRRTAPRRSGDEPSGSTSTSQGHAPARH